MSDAPANTTTVTHEAMATEFTIVVAGKPPTYARQAAKAAFAELDLLEGRLSRFIENSELSRIGRLARGEAAVVSLEVFECLRAALDASAETGGTFDIAYASRTGASVEPLIELDETTRSVRALQDGVQLDAGAIGKGFALDHMAAVLADWDVQSALLRASFSTVLALDPPPGESGWLVTFGGDADRRDLRLAHRAMSGSGTAVKGAHIVNPRTGQPVTGRFRCWAVAPTGALSDALSTAFMIMSDDEIRAYCDKHSQIAAYTLESPDANLVEHHGPNN
jgi:thiamine biosynthesis lipoprotein